MAKSCEFCGKEIEYSEIPIEYEDSTLHYLCYQIKRFIRDNPDIVKRELSTDSQETY